MTVTESWYSRNKERHAANTKRNYQECRRQVAKGYYGTCPHQRDTES